MGLKGDEDMDDYRARRVVLTHRGALRARPEAVFPELCPQCEHDWLDGWRSRTVFSASGHAEAGCVFTTDSEGKVTWVVSRYEPNQRIEFTLFSDRGFVVRLLIALEPGEGGGTRIAWEREYTTLSPAGEEWVEALSQESFAARMSDVDLRLDHYLEHGTMLRDGHGPFAHHRVASG
jgi:hypothetical protein